MQGYFHSKKKKPSGYDNIQTYIEFIVQIGMWNLKMFKDILPAFLLV